MTSKNELMTRIVAGLVVGLMVVLTTICFRSTAAVAAALDGHKDDDTPHAGIAVANARLEMIETQLKTMTSSIGVIQGDIKTILKERNSP